MKGDFLIKTNNPQATDRTLQSFGGLMLGGGMPGGYVMHDGCYVVRPMPEGNGFPRFACEKQGYAEVVGDAPDPAPWDVKIPYEDESIEEDNYGGLGRGRG